MFPNDKFGGRSVNQKRVEMYFKTMDLCNLVDLGYVENSFTWTNKRHRNQVLERLDRGWGNVEWLTCFRNASITHLPCITSDHCPLHIKLAYTPTIHVIKPFRFEPIWLCDPNFNTVVNHAWNERGDGIEEKFYVVGNKLQDWNVRSFDNVDHKKKRVVVRLEGVQKALHTNPNSDFYMDSEITLQNKMIPILNQEEWLWKIKCRTKWHAEGERNSSYFHKSVVISTEW